MQLKTNTTTGTSDVMDNKKRKTSSQGTFLYCKVTVNLVSVNLVIFFEAYPSGNLNASIPVNLVSKLSWLWLICYVET
jgi:hypothetical protein